MVLLRHFLGSALFVLLSLALLTYSQDGNTASNAKEGTITAKEDADRL